MVPPRTPLANNLIRSPGLNCMWLTGCWWPTMRTTGRFVSAGSHRKRVKSSEQDTRSSRPPIAARPAR